MQAAVAAPAVDSPDAHERQYVAQLLLRTHWNAQYSFNLIAWIICFW